MWTVERGRRTKKRIIIMACRNHNISQNEQEMVPTDSDIHFVMYRAVVEEMGFQFGWSRGVGGGGCWA